MKKNNVTIYVGPPGTGKTHTLLCLVEELLRSGLNPASICFLAFTRKAANGARERAMEKFKFDADQLPYFRTLHSLVFKELGLTRQSLMGSGDYCAIARMLGIYITLRQNMDEGSTQGMERGDRLLFYEGLARAKGITLREQWESIPDEDIDWDELERLETTLKTYKKENGKTDFTDMLRIFIDRKIRIPCSHFIVDEAQDLSPVQWMVIDHLVQKSDKLIVAGDDDQAIFRWAGADVDRFIDMPGGVVVLSQSFRVPASIMDAANNIISEVKHRREKKWRPRDSSGEVSYITDLGEVDMSKGSWYLLARNAYLTEEYIDHCMQMGYVFDSLRGSPYRGEALQAVKYWEQLRKGKSVPVHLIRKVYDYMSVRDRVKYGCKQLLDKEEDNKLLTLSDLRACYGLMTDEIWHVALDRLNDEEREYFLTALRKGENLLRDPRIWVSTIHGVKGGEADNVVIMTDMALRTFNEMQENPDDEARVWYVAMTRAKERLFILSPRTNLHHPSLI